MDRDDPLDQRLRNVLSHIEVKAPSAIDAALVVSSAQKQRRQRKLAVGSFASLVLVFAVMANITLSSHRKPGNLASPSTALESPCVKVSESMGLFACSGKLTDLSQVSFGIASSAALPSTQTSSKHKLSMSAIQNSSTSTKDLPTTDLRKLASPSIKSLAGEVHLGIGHEMRIQLPNGFCWTTTAYVSLPGILGLSSSSARPSNIPAPISIDLIAKTAGSTYFSVIGKRPISSKRGAVCGNTEVAWSADVEVSK